MGGELVGHAGGVVVERRPDRRLRPGTGRAARGIAGGTARAGWSGSSSRHERRRSAPSALLPAPLARRGSAQPYVGHEPGSGGHGVHAGPDTGRRVERASSTRSRRTGTSMAGACGPSRSPGVAPFVGFTGLWPATHVLGYESREVGWRLAREHWGHGYATEAARESLRFGFQDIGFDEIVSFTVPENIRSRAVMERIGLRARRGRRLRPPAGRCGRVPAHRPPRPVPAGPADLGGASGKSACEAHRGTDSLAVNRR